jgi:hypothetical protein
MCVDKELLVKFYGDPSFTSLRVLLNYRALSAVGKSFDYFLLEEPWRVYEVLEKALGRHNAELFLRMLSEWLRRNGCDTSLEELRLRLSDRSLWRSPTLGNGGFSS